MNKNASKEGPSKRQVLREQRQKKERQKRLTTLLGIAAVALLIVALFALPALRGGNSSVGAITPVAPRTDLPQPDGTALGDPNAPVKIEIFEDFQCPACRTYSENIEPRVLSELVATGKAYYVFRHYPFIDDRSATKESDNAANASMCASDQGKFWDYHDMLYTNWQSENQGAFNDNRLKAFAEQVGLDMTRFNTCFEDKEFQSVIDTDLADALKYGVSGTPSVFVNGQAVTPGYVPSFDDINAAVSAASGG